MMIRKIFFILLCALCAVSCKKENGTGVSEEDDIATLDFYIDWSALDKEPEGITLCLFPCDVEPVDPKVRIMHSNDVNHVTVKVPNQDYSVICFNQTENEFRNLKFNLSSFDSARVEVVTDAEKATKAINDFTRGFNASAQLTPKSLGSASIGSLKGSTRGFNASAQLTPKPSINQMSISAKAYGISKSNKVKATLTNLSKGVSLADNKPLTSRINQEIPEDAWTIEASPADSIPGLITAYFGTFGIDPNIFAGTRGYLENVRVPLDLDGDGIDDNTGELLDDADLFKMNITLVLDLKVYEGDKIVLRRTMDVTEQVASQVNEVGQPQKADVSLVVGYGVDTTVLIVPPSSEGINVGVNDWSARKDTIIEI